MRGERGEVGLGVKNDEIRVDQEWPLSPSFLCLSRLRGKERVRGIEGITGGEMCVRGLDGIAEVEVVSGSVFSEFDDVTS